MVRRARRGSKRHMRGYDALTYDWHLESPLSRIAPGGVIHYELEVLK